MPGSGEITLRDYVVADQVAAIDVLARSFIDFPPLQVMIGTDEGALDRLGRMFALMFGDGLKLAAIVAEMDARIVGVLTYEDLPDCNTMTPGLILRLMRIAGPRLFRTIRLYSRVEKMHPGTPHRHLPSIGVDPTHQGSGIGERLMVEFDRRCDEDGLPGYLETIRWVDEGRLSHQRFYERMGYAVIDELPETDEWSMLSMLRPVGGTDAMPGRV